MSYVIDANMLQDQFVRLSPGWLDRHDLGEYNRVAYMHRDRKTVLIGLQLPEQRHPGDIQNFIMWIDGVEAWYRYEQNGKRTKVKNETTHQVHLFLLDVTFPWARKDFPKQAEILGGGRTITLEQLRNRMRQLMAQDRLFIVNGRSGRVFFIEEDFELRTEVGTDPDTLDTRRRRTREPEEDFDGARNGLQGRVNRSDMGFYESKTGVEAKLTDSNEVIYLEIENVSASDLLATIKDSYPETRLVDGAPDR